MIKIKIFAAVFSSFYQQFIRKELNTDSNSQITFDLIEDKWESLLKALSVFKLPVTKEYRLNYVPADSEFVRMFASNLSEGQKEFTFNLFSNERLESSKYIKELKLAAANTKDEFFVKNLNFSVVDFWGLVVSAKLAKKLYINYSKIPLDSKFEFGQQLDVCNIRHLDMDGCGAEDSGEWASNSERFENLLEAISKWVAFKNSLKTLDIAYCGVTKEKAEEIRKKYGLDELEFNGLLM